MTLQEFNNLDKSEVSKELEKCCVSKKWIVKLANHHPFESKEALLEIATKEWQTCNTDDFLEAFKGHPKIGNVSSLRAKYGNTKAWAGNEQAGVNIAPEEILLGLAEGNRDYEEKFGFIFIVCATGKRADEMLKLLQDRLPNPLDIEIKIAAKEQDKITRIRLSKLVVSV